MIGIQILVGHITGKSSSASSAVNKSGDSTSLPGDAEIPSYFARPRHPIDGILYSQVPKKIAPIWPLDSLLDIIVLISPSSDTEPIPSTLDERVVLNEVGFKLGNNSDERVIDTSFDIPTKVQNNGTLWGHFYIGLTGNPLDSTLPNYNSDNAYYFRWPLTQHTLLKREKKTKNLLTSSDKNVEPLEQGNPSKPTIVTHYHPNFTLSFIPDTGILEFPNILPPVRQYFCLERSGARDASGQNGWYYPVLFINTFWQLRSQLIPLNSTTQRLPIHINLNNMANWKFNLISSIDEGAKQAARTAVQGISIL